MAGRLILCASPIGNLGDASPRLAEALAAADVVYAEDTRRTRTLLQHLGVSASLRSYFAGNEAARAEELGEHLAAGATVALVTDAGMPALADPGLSAVRAALAAGARVTVVPGPSAITAALAVSGLASERFVFEGFLPRRGAERRRRVAAVAAEERTVVLFSPRHRLAADLADLAAAAGGSRPVVVARELTKLHEEVWRGTLAEAERHWQDARGEVTLVLAGAPPREAGLEEAVAEVRARMAQGESLSEAARAVADVSGLARRRLYQAVVEERST